MRNFSGGYQNTPVQNMYGSQEMPMTPNQLLLNGKIFLAESLSNDNNGPLQHYYQYAFPFHVLPNLNSSPEKIASTGMSDDVCYPPTPVTLDKNKRIQDPSPQKVIDLVDGSVINGNSQGEVLQTTAEGVFDKPENGEAGKGENEVIDLNKTPQQKQRRKKHRPKVIREGKSARKPATPKPVTPKPPMNKETPSGKRKYVRKKKIPDNSDTPSCPLGESVDQDNGGGNTSVRRCLNFDSGEPHAKDGCEGQSRIFVPNVEAPQVQDSCIQGTITGKETPSGKRKYVKKQKIPDISDTPSCPLGEVVSQDNVSGTTSVRRCLNFNSGELQAKDGCKGTSMNFALNAEAPQAQNSCIRGTIISSSNKLNVPSVEGEEVVLENPLTRFMFDLNSSASQDFSKTPQTPTPSQSSPRMTPQTPSPCSPPSRIETTRPSQWLNWNIGAAKKFPMPPQVPQQTRREILWENLKGFGWKNDCLRIAGPSGISQEAGKKNQPEPNNTTDVPMRGTKRGHNLVNEESLSPHRNSIHASNWINRISETPDKSRHGSYFSESDKKKRTEKGQTELTSNASTPVKRTPSSCLRPKLVVPNSCEVLSFSGEERPINFPESDSKKRTEKGQTELPSSASIPVQRTSSSCLRPKPVVPNDSEFFSFSGAERSINFPENDKKKRTEKGQIELISNASIPVQRNPSSSLRPKLVVPNNCEIFTFSGAERPRTTSWNTSVLMPSNCEVFTFADAQRLMAHEKTRASECMLSFDQGDPRKMSMIPVQTNNLTSLSMMRVYNNLPTPVKSSGYHNTEGRQPSIPEKTYGCSDRQESEAFRSQICSEVSNGNDHAKKKTKRKEYTHIVKPMPSNTNGIHFPDDEAASCSNGSLYGKSPVQVTASSPGNFQDKNPHLHISSLQDCQSSNNFKESTHVISVSGAIVPHHDSIDEIVWKLRGLNINGGQKNVASEVQNALVPYGAGGGTVVPYEGPFDPTKKRRPRVKVDLDPETNRVWNVLMGKESSDEKIDMDKEKWWEEERKVFRGRVDSFIARMHLIQGDRRFSRWKGSVVDSVVGVFLTQNVSDHLSSSAFMALAARFPPRSDGDMSKPPNAEKVDSNEPLGCNNGDGDFDNLSGKGCNVPERDLEIGRESPPSSSSTPVTVTGVTSIAEAEGRRSMEDVLSSQNSTVSSQNSSEFLVQRADQTQMGSSLNFEDLIYGGVCNGLNNSTSFLDLLQMAETTRLPGLYSHPSVCIPNPQPSDKHHHLNGGPWSPSPSYQPQNYSNSRFMANGDVHAVGDGESSHFPSTRATSTSYDFTGLPWSPSSYQPHNFSSSRFMTNGNVNVVGDGGSSHLPSTRSTSRTAPVCDLYAPVIKHSEPPITCSESEVHVGNHSFCPSNLTREKAEGSSGSNTPNKCSHLQDEQTSKLQRKERGVEFIAQAQMQSGLTYQTSLNSPNYSRETPEVADAVESNLKPEAASAATANSISKTDKVKPSTGKTKERDWDELRKQAYRDGARKERSKDAMDSLDWEAIRSANVSEISYTIRERGMNNMLAERIKGFLDRIVKDHGSIDLEWLRDVPPDAAKDYLLSIRGLGLKSVECVRLLTLHHLAFPVDTNVGRICVRLGWVPLQPLPESLQLHLLEMYPVLETIQKYIWPRLCKLDQRTLYELHYQMITFGKVFCTKSKPNCNACPMRGECKHFASAFANLRLSLPGPEEKGLVSSTVPISFETDHPSVFNPMHLPQLKESPFSHEGFVLNNCEPIIEEPASPEPEHIKSLESDIEDAFYEDPDEIPMIKLNLEEFTQNVQNYMQENNMDLQDGDFSKALVAITPDAASIPTPKLKNVRRLRTEHQVYELPDSHPLLKGLDQREPDDPCSYFLAIWSPGETAQSTELEQESCNSRDTGKLCDKKTCFDCNSIREAHAQTVRGTLLIPCRTAMRGSFPLNGTYFQVNEVFADHASSCNPIDVPRELIWNLPRRTVYFGTSVPTIFKGLTTEEIQQCFWRGFVCVRGFDRATRAPKPLYARLHFPASKTTRNRQAAAGAPAAPAAREEE